MALSTITTTIGPFEHALLEYMRSLGGPTNFHAHFDRADTLAGSYFSGFDMNPIEHAALLSLKQKQLLTGELHKGPGYKEENLAGRLRACLDDAIQQGVKHAISFIDSTPDVDLLAMQTAATLREEYADKIHFQLAAHPIFGFKQDPRIPRSRWEVFTEACSIADIIGSLPEKDERNDSIGYDEHLRRTLELAIELGKPYHAHVDQANKGDENGTETLTDAVHWLGSPKVADSQPGEPTVWAVHAISPSCYDEDRFLRLTKKLVSNEIGVVVCPSAALSMRQHRDRTTPTHNSIARVLEMAREGVQIRIGTDNLSDVFVPTYVTMLDELKTLANTLRFYDVPTLAKFAAGVPLNATNLGAITRHLESAR